MDKRPESVLVVVATDHKQVLCLQRNDVKNFWQSVTGSLLTDELPFDAAVRELYEETGLSLNDGTLVDCNRSWWFDIYPHWQHRYPPGTTRNLEHVFLFIVHELQPIKLSKEHKDYKWLAVEEAIVSITSNTNKTAILEYIVEQEEE